MQQHVQRGGSAVHRRSALPAQLPFKPIRCSTTVQRRRVSCRLSLFPSFQQMTQKKETDSDNGTGPKHDYSKIAISGDLPKDYDTDIPNWSAKRRAGVIIHPTSLPGPYGIGELGEQARQLVDWIVSADLQVRQVTHCL